MYCHYYTASHMFHGSLPEVMGSRLDVLLFGSDEKILACLWADIVAEVQRLGKMLNRFDPTSELSLAAAKRQTPSAELHNILHDCQAYKEKTGGFFDIEWQAGSYDLGGYAKGYALRKIREMLEPAGQAYINFGDSSQLFIGNDLRGKPWQVAIVNPADRIERDRILVSNTSLSVSGNSPGRPRHIFNPHTGSYLGGRLLAAVVADDPVEAEVLSTTLLLVNAKQADTLASQFNIKTYYTYND